MSLLKWAVADPPPGGWDGLTTILKARAMVRALSLGHVIRDAKWMSAKHAWGKGAVMVFCERCDERVFVVPRGILTRTPPLVVGHVVTTRCTHGRR